MNSLESLTRQIGQAFLNDLRPSGPLKLNDLPRIDGSMEPDVPPCIMIGYTANTQPVVMRVLDRGTHDLSQFENDLIDHIRIVPIDDTAAANSLLELLDELFRGVILTSTPKKSMRKEPGTYKVAAIDPETGEPRRRGRPRIKALPDPSAPKRPRGRPKSK
jgi:hypothetical protein